MLLLLRLLPLLAAFLLLPLGRGSTETAESGREKTVFLFENRKVTVQVPADLGYNVSKDDHGLVHVRVADVDDTLSLHVVFLPDPENRFDTARARREQMFELFQDYVDDSTEKAMVFEELEPRTGAGTYCVFTDTKLVGKASLPPGEFLHLTAGVKTWPGVIAVFRLFSNDVTSPHYRAVMKMLRESVEERAVPLK